MPVIKKLFRSLLILLVILILLSPFWIKNIPLKYLTFLTGKTNTLDKYVCKYSIQVSGDSMAPLITRGSSIELSRCFEESDLSKGLIVLYTTSSDMHLAIIRHVLTQKPIVYKVSNERPGERLQNIIKEEIVAVNKDIDTSKSSYELSPVDEKAFVLDPDEYLSDFYLGKVPRGYGEEMAEVERTDVFSSSEDKFCTVTIPKKELAFVDTEIIDAKTQDVLRSSGQFVLNVQPDPNINCEDFGSDDGMLDLEPGDYYFVFLLNHQILYKIHFSVK